MIEIEHLSKKFGNFFALSDINLHFKSGESVILMGQNGAGKTTLVRSILGEQIPSSGRVLIEGKSPLKNREAALSHIALVPQMPPPVRLSSGELIKYAALSSGTNERRIFELCDELELDIKEQSKKLFFKLSGGMKQKLLIAIALAKEPDIFIFDEPTANLDPKGRENFYRLISKQKENKLLLFISHRLEELKNLVGRKIEMELGKVVNDEKI